MRDDLQRRLVPAAALLAAGVALSACETKDPCDGIDNDGDGYYDEDLAADEVIRPWFPDADGDGFGDVDFVVNPPIWACAAPGDRVNNNLDCDDTDAGINPDAPETCNGIDDDCDGEVDDGVGETYFTDADGDGFGDADAPVVACEQPSGTATDDADCDDTDAATHPGAEEVCDGADNDCDGVLPDDETVDADGDGSPLCADCDDTDAATHPGAEEVCDGLDNDCDGAVPADEADDDGDGYLVCGGAAGAPDCDDGDPAVHPDAIEVCDGVDADCDGVADDGDLDGSGVADCDEVVAVVSAPFAAITATCDAAGMPYPDAEVEAVADAADTAGLSLVVADEDATLGVDVQALAGHAAVVVLNGGLPWSDGFWAGTLPALTAVRQAGIPVAVVGDDAADQLDAHPELVELLGIEGYLDGGAPDSVNILAPTHPVIDGPHGFVYPMYVDADMDVAGLAPGGVLIGELASTSAPAIVVQDAGADAATVLVLFAIAAGHDACPQTTGDTDILLANALSWLLQP